MSKNHAVRWRPALVGLGLAVASHAPGAVLPQSAQTAVVSYSAELSQVEHAKGRVSLERLFLMAYAMGDELTVSAVSGGNSPLEALTEDELASTKGQLRGLVVTREESVFAVPDPEFFEKLGERKGRTEDRLLLRMYRRTYESPPWPVYVRQQTDVSGCTDYGPGKLTTLYGEWSRYRTLHPDRYRAVVDAELRKIVGALTKPDCACGPSGSVQSEFRYFLHRHPGSPIVPEVRERLNELLHGTSKIRLNCTSG